MSDDRIKEDPSILPEPGQPADLGTPFMIVGMPGEGERFRVGLALDVMDPGMNTPEIFGVVLSDLIDQVAHAYASVGAGDPASLRALIHRVVRDEHKLKQKDPARGKGRGATSWPKNGRH